MTIESIYLTIPTTRAIGTLYKIAELASTMGESIRVLIIGAGLGAEIAAIHELSPKTEFTAVDDWSFSFLSDKASIDVSVKGIENTRENFERAMKDRGIRVEIIQGDGHSKGIRPLLDRQWDLVYYDCTNGLNLSLREEFIELMMYLWRVSSHGAAFMGNYYYFSDPDIKMTPWVDEMSSRLGVSVEFDRNNEDRFWIIRKAT